MLVYYHRLKLMAAGEFNYSTEELAKHSFSRHPWQGGKAGPLTPDQGIDDTINNLPRPRQ
jgi:hypothetical protein